MRQIDEVNEDQLLKELEKEEPVKNTWAVLVHLPPTWRALFRAMGEVLGLRNVSDIIRFSVINTAWELGVIYLSKIEDDLVIYPTVKIDRRFVRRLSKIPSDMRRIRNPRYEECLGGEREMELANLSIFPEEGEEKRGRDKKKTRRGVNNE